MITYIGSCLFWRNSYLFYWYLIGINVSKIGYLKRRINMTTRPRLVTGAAGATVLTVLLTVAATVAGLVALVTEAAGYAAVLFSGAAGATATDAVLLTVAVGTTAGAAAGANADLEPGA